MTEANLHPRAAMELAAAVDYYDEQSWGLGDEFATAVERTVAAIAEHPLLWPQVGRGLRRALVRRFPYAVYYQCHATGQRVMAILHTSRDQAAALRDR